MKTRDILIGLAVALVVAGGISLTASSWPDGLERVAADIGFLHKAEHAPQLSAPASGYKIPFIKNDKLASSAAGIGGTLLVFGLSLGIALLLRKRPK